MGTTDSGSTCLGVAPSIATLAVAGRDPTMGLLCFFRIGGHLAGGVPLQMFFFGGGNLQLPDVQTINQHGKFKYLFQHGLCLVGKLIARAGRFLCSRSAVPRKFMTPLAYLGASGMCAPASYRLFPLPWECQCHTPHRPEKGQIFALQRSHGNPRTFYRIDSAKAVDD